MKISKEQNCVNEILKKSGGISKELQGIYNINLSTTKGNRRGMKYNDNIALYDEEIKAIQKYRKRICIIWEGEVYLEKEGCT